MSAAHRRQTPVPNGRTEGQPKPPAGQKGEGAGLPRKTGEKPSPARRAALHALQSFRRQGAAEPVRCERADDTRLAERLFFGVLQNERFLDACVARFLSSSAPHPYVADLLRLGAYQILFLDRVPDSAAVNDAVALCRASKQRYASGMVNAVLRRVSAEKAALLEPAGEGALAVRYSHPDWLTERLLREHDTDFVRAFLESNQELPPLTLQLNTRRTDPETFLGRLRGAGIEPLSVRPDFPSVRIPSTRVDELPGYPEGLFFVQDDAARASIRVLGLRPGSSVLDACAAPGGKSAAAVLEGAEVLACDLNPKRLERCTENFARLGMEVPVRQADAAVFCPEFRERFDAVIADVPCSGTGVIRRHPEIRRRSLAEAEQLLPIQRRILANLATYVRPGGALLYSTCSVLRDENEAQVEAFLSENPAFSLAPVRLEGFDCENGCLRSWTHENGNDGFFAAKLVKRASAE